MNTYKRLVKYCTLIKCKAYNLEEILEHFEVFGQKDAQFQKFEKGVEYQGFLVRRRS